MSWVRGRRPAPVLASLPAYDRWAADYPPHAHNALMLAEQTAVLAALPPLAGCVVLDLACGTGRYARLAAERQAASVIAIDNSLPMLRAGWAAGALAAPVRALAGHVNALPLAASTIDGVICGLALGHLPVLDAALGEIARVLVPGGWAVISDVHPVVFAAGGQRTFSAEGRTFAVEHTVHDADAYARAGQAAGLALTGVHDVPLIGADGSRPAAVVYVFQRGRETSI